MRQHRVARAVLQRGDAAELGEQPQVAAVGRSVDVERRTATGHVVHRLHALHQIALGGEPAAGELAAPPLHLHRVIAQPRVAGAGARDRVLQVRTRGVDRLTDGHSHAPFRDQQVGHRRGPVAAVHGADGDRVSERPACGERVDGEVPARFELGDGRPQRPELLDGTHAVAPTRRVRGLTTDAQPEGERSTVRGDDVHLRGLRDHAGIGAPAALQRRVRAEAAILLAEHAGQQQVAAQPHARGLDGMDGVRRCNEAGLHVAGAATVHATVADLRGERRIDPCVGIAGGHHVDVAVEHQRCTVAGAVQPTDHAPRLATIHLHAGEVGTRSEVRQIDLPVIDVETVLGEVRRHVRLCVVLGVGAAHAGNAHHRGELVEHRLPQCFHCVENPGCCIGHAASLASARRADVTRRGAAFSRRAPWRPRSRCRW